MHSQWPDGVYEGVPLTDDDGETMGRTVQVEVRLEIKGDEATFDFAESGHDLHVAPPIICSSASFNLV